MALLEVQVMRPTWEAAMHWACEMAPRTGQVYRVRKLGGVWWVEPSRRTR